MNITKKAIESLPVPKTGFKPFFDDKLTGFLVRVYSSGTISFWCYYYFNGKKKWLQLGRFGKITVDQARMLAKKTIAEVSLGQNPAQSKKEMRKKLPAFGDLVEKYRSTYAKKNSLQTQRDYDYFLDKVLLPKLRHRELANIERAELEKIAFDFKSTKSKRTGKEMSGARVNKMIALISRLFNLALGWQWITYNPAKGMEKFREVKRERVATDEESARLLMSIQEEEDPVYRNYFLVMWLTMARRGEIQKMRWEDLDLDAGFYRMETTKAGRPFTIPLNEDAIEILRGTPRISGSPFVFTGRSGDKPINGISKAWQRIRSRARVEDLWVHDIRRTGGSNLVMNGASLQDVALVLNHSNLSTTQRYAQLAQSHKQKIMDGHGDRLRGILQGKVVPFEEAKEALKGSVS